jgi:hypothetical protein
MLTKSQAGLIGDQIVATAESARRARQDARAPALWPRWYRSAALRALAPWQRRRAIEQARAAVLSAPVFVCWVFVWLGASAWAWMATPDAYGGRVVGLFAAGWLVTAIARTILVRQRAHRLASELLRASQFDDR